MIKIHHARPSRGARVVWLCEELGVPYEIVPHEFNRSELQNPAYLALQPLGQLPAIEDGDVRMFESGAILGYLLEKYGQGRLAPAPGTRERAEYLQWFHFGEASLAVHVTTIVRHRFGRSEERRLEGAVTEGRERAKLGIEVVERALHGRAYILGDDFTAADIMVSYGIVMANFIGELPDGLENVRAYMARLKERPAYGPAWA
jgi:glutathione S-transferase